MFDIVLCSLIVVKNRLPCVALGDFALLRRSSKILLANFLPCAVMMHLCLLMMLCRGLVMQFPAASRFGDLLELAVARLRGELGRPRRIATVLPGVRSAGFKPAFCCLEAVDMRDECLVGRVSVVFTDLKMPGRLQMVPRSLIVMERGRIMMAGRLMA